MTVPTSDADTSSLRVKYRGGGTDPAAPSPAQAMSPDTAAGAEAPAERGYTSPEWRPEPTSPAAEGPARSVSSNRIPVDVEEVFAPAVIGGRVEPAKRGVRGWINQTFHTTISKSADEIEYDKRIAEIQRPLRMPKRIAVLSGKGGSGKTVVALNLGATIAHRPGKSVVAVSIDPLGNITDRVRQTSAQTPKSVMSMYSDPSLANQHDVDSYLLTDVSGMRVLGSSNVERDAPLLNPDGLERVLSVVKDFYNTTVIDFGLDINSAVYHRALGRADQLVLTAATTTDSIRELHRLIAVLQRFSSTVGHDRYIELLKDAIVVLVQTSPGKPRVNLEEERAKFAKLNMKVFTIPFDEHIAEGGPMSLDLLNEETRLPFVWLAAEVMKKLPND